MVHLGFGPEADVRSHRDETRAGDDAGRATVQPRVTTRTIDARGLVAWPVELPPLGRRAVTLEHRARSQRDVVEV